MHSHTHARTHIHTQTDASCASFQLKPPSAHRPLSLASIVLRAAGPVEIYLKLNSHFRVAVADIRRGTEATQVSVLTRCRYLFCLIPGQLAKMPTQLLVNIGAIIHMFCRLSTCDRQIVFLSCYFIPRVCPSSAIRHRLSQRLSE